MISDADMYAEAFEMLSYMDKRDVMKIPLEILELIKRKKNDSYVSRIDKTDIYNRNNVDSRTISLLTGLKIKYFSEPEEKARIIANCDKLYKEKYKTEYNDYSRIFDNNINEKISEKEIIENSLVEVKTISLFERIKLFLKSLFN